MRLDATTCWARIGPFGHGTLGTLHPDRGLDVVPVVYVIDRDQIIIPIDAVKPKSGRRLQRLSNLAADARCVLLVDHYADDWSELWWVRAHGHAIESHPSPDALAALGRAFPMYRAADSVTSLIVMTIDSITGWSALPDPA